MIIDIGGYLFRHSSLSAATLLICRGQTAPTISPATFGAIRLDGCCNSATTEAVSKLSAVIQSIEIRGKELSYQLL